MKKRFLSVLLAALTLLGTGLFSACNGSGADKEYTIRYSYDGNAYDLQVQRGKAYSLETIPEKVGYEFMGLYDAAVGGKIYVGSDGFSLKTFSERENIVLFPQFRARKYTVIFEYGEGVKVTDDRSVTVECDGVLDEVPTYLTAEHKVFKGWYTKPDCGGKQVADQYGVRPEMETFSAKNYDLENSDGYVRLYAGFEWEKYVVSFRFGFGNGSAEEEIEVAYNTPIGEIVPETRVDGKAVLKWSKRQNDTEQKYLFTGKVTEDMTLYAAELAPVIDFEPKGGEAVAPIVRESGTTVTLPAATKTNYTFLYWRDKSGKIYSANEKVVLTDSLKLEAVWQAMLIFDERGGVEVADLTAAQGETIVLPTTEKAGFIFAGWYDGDEKYTSAAMPAESVLLTAKYYAVLTKTAVLIEADTKVDTSRNTSPSIDKVSVTLDVGELYAAGVTQVQATAHYEVRHQYGCTSKDIYSYMNWYSQASASDAYKMWSYQDKHIDTNWASHTKSANLTLSGDKIYICFYTNKAALNYNAYWTDFWVELAYPDMSVLV